MSYLIIILVGVGIIAISLAIFFSVKHFSKNSDNDVKEMESKSLLEKLKFSNDCEDLGNMVNNLDKHSVKIKYDYRK